MGVALDLDGERSESRFIGEVLPVEDTLGHRVSVEKFYYRVSPVEKKVGVYGTQKQTSDMIRTLCMASGTQIEVCRSLLSLSYM